MKVQAWWGWWRSWTLNSQSGGWWWAWGYCERMITGLVPGSTIPVTVWVWWSGWTSPTAGWVSFFGSYCSAWGWAQWVIWWWWAGWVWSNGDLNLRWWSGGHPMPYGATWDSWWEWWNSVFFGNGNAGKANVASTAWQANSGAWWGGGTWSWSWIGWSNGWSGIVIVYW